MKDGEVVGLHCSSNGRSCTAHAVCGAHLRPNDLVRFKFTLIDVAGRVEEALKVVRVVDGTEMCVVGFSPQHVVTTRRDKFEDKFAQIIEVYDNSDNCVRRSKSKRVAGCASFRLLEQIPRTE